VHIKYYKTILNETPLIEKMYYYILRYGEIGLKGLNRPEFENKLSYNILEFIKNTNKSESKITKVRGRLILKTKEQQNLQPIFGLVSYSEAIPIEKDLNKISDKCVEIFETMKNVKTFKVETQRLDKTFKIKSPKINRIVGEKIFTKFEVPGDMKNPELKIGIEIHTDKAYIYTTSIECFGGLPLGVSNSVNIIHENNKETILSALSLMKRGCSVNIVSESNDCDFNLLKIFNNNKKINLIKKINNNEAIALTNNFKEIIDNKEELKKYKNNLILYPLALLSKEEIKKELEKYNKIIRT